MSGPFLAVTTLAFGVTASSYFLQPNYLPWFVTTQANRPTLFGASVLNSDAQVYYFCLAGFFLVLLAVRSLRQSRTGRDLIATRDNEPAARAAAVNTTRHKLLAFAISGGIAGFAGSLFAVQQQGINSGSFTADINITMFSMVVIGGLGSMPGVILGAVVVWGAQYYLPAGYAQFVNGLGILLLLLFLPEGIGGLLNRGRDQLLRVVARRRGITAAGIWRRPDRGHRRPTHHTTRERRGPARWTASRPTCSPSASIRAPMADAHPPPTAHGRPSRLTGTYSPRPLIAVMGLGAILPMSALIFVLQLPQMQDAYQQGLSLLALLAVQQLQTGLGPDFALGPGGQPDVADEGPGRGGRVLRRRRRRPVAGRRVPQPDPALRRRHRGGPRRRRADLDPERTPVRLLPGQPATTCDPGPAGGPRVRPQLCARSWWGPWPTPSAGRRRSSSWLSVPSSSWCWPPGSRTRSLPAGSREAIRTAPNLRTSRPPCPRPPGSSPPPDPFG